VKLNSRARNPRHLQDALCALSLAVSAANTLPPALGTSPPPLRSDRAVLAAVQRAARAGATPREIRAVTRLPLDWVRGAAMHGPHGGMMRKAER
jgi:hypothetical protein